MPEFSQDDMASRQARLAEVVAMILDESRRQGASAAEAGATASNGLSVTVRLSEVETIEHQRDNSIGVTVYFGYRKGSASTSDTTPEAIRETVRAACDGARYTTEDIHAGLADASRMARDLPDLELYHPWALTPEDAIEVATRCEDSARGLDARIVNSEGASLSLGMGLVVYGNSHGFMGGFPATHHSLSCSVIAGDETGMQRDDWWTFHCDPAALEAPESVGRRAAEGALARLGGQRLTTRRCPVIFRADIAVGLLRSLISAISGSAQYRRSSFLLDALGQTLFPPFVQVFERPQRRRGLASAPFDGEGVATYDKDFVTDGILQSYVLDSYAARKLGRQTTANAGGVRNLEIQSGTLDRDALLREMGTGLLVTELLGSGVNLVTGDYSRGAAGFWVEQGVVQYPVEEITIAGNLKDMFHRLAAVGNDQEHRGSTRTGSWWIEEMTVAGG
ncbi:Metalloprotease PmbA [Gammaproteobacteria bacterium]